jgi:FlaA1/EpsC-like NDP-sugar epimerase
VLNRTNEVKDSIKTLPSFSDIAQGKVTLSDIKDLDLEDILNRDQAMPNTELLTKNITPQLIIQLIQNI